MPNYLLIVEKLRNPENTEDHEESITVAHENITTENNVLFQPCQGIISEGIKKGTFLML